MNGYLLISNTSYKTYWSLLPCFYLVTSWPLTSVKTTKKGDYNNIEHWLYCIYLQHTNEIKLFSDLTNQSGGSCSSSPPFNLFQQEVEPLRTDSHNMPHFGVCRCSREMKDTSQACLSRDEVAHLFKNDVKSRLDFKCTSGLLMLTFDYPLF